MKSLNFSKCKIKVSLVYTSRRNAVLQIHYETVRKYKNVIGYAGIYLARRKHKGGSRLTPRKLISDANASVDDLRTFGVRSPLFTHLESAFYAPDKWFLAVKRVVQSSSTVATEPDVLTRYILIIHYNLLLNCFTGVPYILYAQNYKLNALTVQDAAVSFCPFSRGA